MKIRHLLGVGLTACAISGSALAGPVTPASYAFDQATSSGTYVYSDPTLSKLTDGVLGAAGWGVNAAAAWVGWSGIPLVNIDFNFGSAKDISTIEVGTTQDDLADVVLPPYIDVFTSSDGSTWSFVQQLYTAPSSANNHDWLDSSAHGFLTLNNLGINAQYVRLGLSSYNNFFIFVDEVRFANDTSPVPAPAPLALLAAGLAAMAVRRKR